jgi:hypothetical protein
MRYRDGVDRSHLEASIRKPDGWPRELAVRHGFFPISPYLVFYHGPVAAWDDRCVATIHHVGDVWGWTGHDPFRGHVSDQYPSLGLALANLALAWPEARHRLENGLDPTSDSWQEEGREEGPDEETTTMKISYESYKGLITELESMQGHDGLDRTSEQAVDALLARGGIEVDLPAEVRLENALQAILDAKIDITNRRTPRGLHDAIDKARDVLADVRRKRTETKRD